MTAISRASNPLPDAVLARLKSIAGPAGYLDQPDDIAPFCKSWRDDWVGRVPLVLRPKSTEEVAAIVRTCAEARVAIVPQGGNTGLTGASQPHDDMSEVIVSTSRMNKVRALDPVNDTITVEAGVVLKDIQDAADRSDRLFPLSLGAEGSCQIGGNISTNAGGVQVLRYGNTRSLVLGLEAVMPDGRVWNGLRALRKDNTGYDLKQLLIGAEGTLGIITAAVLRLFPKPTASETAWIAVDSPGHALRLLGHMRKAMGDTLSAFELICRAIIDFLLTGVPGHEDPMRERYPWYVLMDVTSQGAPNSLHGPLSDALAAALEQGIIRDALVASSGAQAAKLWRMRENLAEAQVSAGGSIAHDVSVPVSRIAEFIARADAAVAAVYPNVRPCAFGHLGDGNIHYNPVRPLEWDWPRFRQERAAINRIVHDIVVALGGSISAEHGIGRSRLAEHEHYKSQVELDMMLAVKRALDPANIMNPGKVVRW
ncbi:MAG TPA: FAD-binding oxidoreductase [Hyphomicrobiaceae bacterium]|nr:FAD-binding oxidoreductase [Hyphomicrobiaceae bacterium]